MSRVESTTPRLRHVKRPALSLQASLPTLHALRDQFEAVHAQALAALQAGDYSGFHQAITRERGIINRQKRLFFSRS